MKRKRKLNELQQLERKVEKEFRKLWNPKKRMSTIMENISADTSQNLTDEQVLRLALCNMDFATDTFASGLDTPIDSIRSQIEEYLYDFLCDLEFLWDDGK